MSNSKVMEQLFRGYKIRSLVVKKVEKNRLSEDVTAYVACLLREFFGEETEVDPTPLNFCPYIFPTIEDPKQFSLIIIACLFTFEFDDLAEKDTLGKSFSIWFNTLF